MLSSVNRSRRASLIDPARTEAPAAAWDCLFGYLGYVRRSVWVPEKTALRQTCCLGIRPWRGVGCLGTQRYPKRPYRAVSHKQYPKRPYRIVMPMLRPQPRLWVSPRGY